MTKGSQRRIQPDLLREIEGYEGGSFSEKLVKWRNDVDKLSHDDIEEAVSGMYVDGDGVIRQR